MPIIKRFAFVPLLAYVCAVTASAFADPGQGSTIGLLVGGALAIPIAAFIDHRRHSRPAP